MRTPTVALIAFVLAGCGVSTVTASPITPSPRPTVSSPSPAAESPSAAPAVTLLVECGPRDVDIPDCLSMVAGVAGAMKPTPGAGSRAIVTDGSPLMPCRTGQGCDVTFVSPTGSATTMRVVETPLGSYTGSYLPTSPDLEPAPPTLTIDCSQMVGEPIGVYETLREIPACAWMVSAAAKALAPAPAIGSTTRVAPGSGQVGNTRILARVTFTSPQGTLASADVTYAIAGLGGAGGFVGLNPTAGP